MQRSQMAVSCTDIVQSAPMGMSIRSSLHVLSTLLRASFGQQPCQKWRGME